VVNIMYRCLSEVKTGENTLYGTDSMQFISVIVHLLCSTIALIRESVEVFLADTATRTTA
ncbi:hypothetical protein EZS27_032443, partial [termite gut metagenome]